MSFYSLLVAGSQQEIIIPADLPLVQELGATLREWAQIWQKLYVVCGDFLFYVPLLFFLAHAVLCTSAFHPSDTLFC